METREEYRLAAVMFTDIFGFSRMMEENEIKTLELLKAHNEVINRLVNQYHGNIIKTIGDAFLIDFKNTSDAVKCGLEIQNSLFNFNSENQTNLMIRIGIHLGDIWYIENDVMGEVINIASRLQTLAKPGRICISSDVYNQISNKINAEIVSLGKAKLKNISKEIIAYEILTDFDALESPAEIDTSQTKGLREPVKEDEALKTSVTEIIDEALEPMILDKLKNFDYRVPIDSMRDHLPVPAEKLTRTLNKMVDKGTLTRVETGNQQVEYGIAGARPSPLKRGVKSVKQKIEKRIRGIITRTRLFKSHLATFGTINVFLLAINLLTSPGTIWFQYALGGWGIAMGTHLFGFLAAKRHLPWLQRVPEDTTDYQYKQLVRLLRTEGAFAYHLGAYACANLYLIMVNLITSANTFWAIYPILGWGVGIALHAFATVTRRTSLIGRLRESGFNFDGIKDTRLPIVNQPVSRISRNQDAAAIESKSSYGTVLQQSEKLKSEISDFVRSAKNIDPDKAREIEDLLNLYQSNISQLIRQDAEYSRTTRSTSKADIVAELVVLREKMNTATSESLREEYTRSIEQYERYKTSFEELENQKEVIYLRITSAFMSLKQLQLDLRDIDTASFENDGDSLNQFREKLEDLSNYAKVLKQTYHDLNS